MKIFNRPLWGMVFAVSGTLLAQQGTLSGPVAGFVFDNSSHSLRPVRGIPGASLVGDAVNFGIDTAAVWVAPRQDSAIVVGTDQSLHLFALNGGTPVEVSLGGIAGAPDRVVFSPSGTAVALMGATESRILTGLPGAPQVIGSIKVPGHVVAAGGRNQAVVAPALALSDDGGYALTVAEGSVLVLTPQGQRRVLIHVNANALVAYAPGTHDAAVMDTNAGLTLIRDTAGAAGTQLLAPPDDGLAGPVGVAFSQDGKTVYVASAKSQSVAAFSLAGASRTAIGCNCTPSTLTPMGNVFLLNDVTSGPLWLLDGTAATPRTVFVPARVE
ncbi:MAG TPA: hypothetical protein VMB03_16595 [Bryobacteraceae bacterium]|nr:hypothetical protein [Bryobacteraceae bacterium]